MVKGIPDLKYIVIALLVQLFKGSGLWVDKDWDWSQCNIEILNEKEPTAYMFAKIKTKSYY